MILEFKPQLPHSFFANMPRDSWQSWTWQLQNTLKTLEDFARLFALSAEETLGFEKSKDIFKIATTPYYASLASQNPSIRKIIMPHALEVEDGAQAMKDPLAEVVHSPSKRIIHRYSDRVLFLVTDVCSVYCRYCTRKRFTGNDEGFVNNNDYEEALSYIRSHTGLREVILSGGDPLTISDGRLEKVLSDLRRIPHVEIIRIGTRMPVVCPMRVTESLVAILKKHKPVYVMTHFNHPAELTLEARQALETFVDNGVPIFNQMVLLNGVNNHPAIVQALSRRLLYLRVKPYYMFQCDPSQGTDHLRTSLENSEEILKELWGHLSGLAMPVLSVDIPDGGGKTSLVPDFEVSRDHASRTYRGWDKRLGVYRNPAVVVQIPSDVGVYVSEWDSLKKAKD